MTTKIGIFGGSFNPIHFGHLFLAQEAMVQCQLDQIIFIPAAQPPHKCASDLAPAHARFQMVERAIKAYPEYTVSDIELLRNGPSFTIDTVQVLLDKYNHDNQLYLIVGMDMLTDLFSWKQADKLIDMIKFIGVPRKGYPFEMLDDRLKQKVQMISMPLIEISGKVIRERLRNRMPVRFWVPDGVEEYLQETQLYLKS